MIDNIYSKIRKYPCKDCAKRHEGCHSKCIDYQLARQQRNAINEQRLTEHEIGRGVTAPKRKHDK